MFLKTIKILTFITEMWSVFLEVQTEFLNTGKASYRAVPWLRQLIANFHREGQVRAMVSSCGICGGQSGTWTGFTQSSLVLPCQYHSMYCGSSFSYIIWGMNNRPAGGCSSETVLTVSPH
jgi:hypothetical protein